MERRTILFSGRVQGVGFRMTAVQFAEELPLTGTVRNTEDRDVELVVQGEMADIDALVQRLHEHFGSFIRNTVQRSSPPFPTVRPGQGVRVTY